MSRVATTRTKLLQTVKEYLIHWERKVEVDNGLGLTDINTETEDLFCGLLNTLLDKKLKNLNLLKMDFPAIDLADSAARLCVQVTSTEGREKIEHTLEKFYENDLQQKYDRLIVLIVGRKKKYRKAFPSRDDFSFRAERDVWDTVRLLQEIGAREERLESVVEYLENQLGSLQERWVPMDLPLRSAMEEGAFVGREKELREIGESFETEHMVVLSGLGGMGKTELAVRFGREHWLGQAYFVRFDESFRKTVCGNIAPRVNGLSLEGKTEQQRYDETLAVLKKCREDDLLILDNADQEQESFSMLRHTLSDLPMKILITTRAQGKNTLRLPALEREKLHLIFERHMAAATPEERDRLIDAVRGHTMMVDLIARTLGDNWCTVTPEMILEALEGNPVVEEDYPEVDTDYERDLKQRQIYGHLRVLFQLQKLKQAEENALRCAALLPADGMATKLFLNFLPPDVRSGARALEKRGWIQCEEKLVTIHPVVRLVCWKELGISDESCGAFLEALIGRFDEDKFDQTEYLQLAQVLEEAADRTEDRTGRWALKAGEVWWKLGDVSKPLEFSLRAMERAEKNLGQETPEYAYAVNNVGVSFVVKGEHKKALEYVLKALEIRERVLLPDDPDLAISYNNVGSTYSVLGDHKQALEYELKVISYFEKVLSKDHPHLATIYNNMSYIYGELGDHEKELEYDLKALEIRERVLLPEHPDLATSYNNVGHTYGAMGDHKQALEYNLKALGIRERVLPGNHPDLALSCSNIAWTYHALGQIGEAATHMRRAADSINRSSLPETHPDRVNYNKWAGELEREYEMQQKILAQMREWGVDPFGFGRR